MAIPHMRGAEIERIFVSVYQNYCERSDGKAVRSRGSSGSGSRVWLEEGKEEGEEKEHEKGRRRVKRRSMRGEGGG